MGDGRREAAGREKSAAACRQRLRARARRAQRRRVLRELWPRKAMSAFGPGQLRMTTTRGRTFDWETSKAPTIVTGQGGESCAWHPVNKHLKIIEKIRPPSPLRPKAAVPSLHELQRQDETKMRPTNVALYVDLVKSVAKENSSSSLGRTGKSILEGSASNLGGTAKSGLRQTMTAQDAATMRKREIMELARKEDQENRMETLKKNVGECSQKPNRYEMSEFTLIFSPASYSKGKGKEREGVRGRLQFTARRAQEFH